MINWDSITHWTIIWEEEGHHIFINLEKKVQVYLLFKLGTSWKLDLVLLLLFSKELILQALQHKEMITTEKVGEEIPNSSSMTMQKFKSLLMDLPTSIYIIVKR